MNSSLHIRLLVRLTVLLVATLAAGCDSTRAPGISVLEARVIEQGSNAALVEFTLELTNSNAEPLPLVEFKYAADVDGRRVFESRRAAQATLRRLGTQTLLLPVVIPTGGGGRVLAGPHAIAVSGKLSYIAPGQLGELLFDTGVRVPKVSFNESVQVDFGNADGS